MCMDTCVLFGFSDRIYFSFFVRRVGGKGGKGVGVQFCTFAHVQFSETKFISTGSCPILYFRCRMFSFLERSIAIVECNNQVVLRFANGLCVRFGGKDGQNEM